MYKKNVVHHNQKGLTPGIHQLFYGYPQPDFILFFWGGVIFIYFLFVFNINLFILIGG